MVGIGRLLFGVADGEVDVGQQHGAVGIDAVERAGLNQRFQRALVHVFFAHPFAKIEQVAEAAVLPCFNDTLYRAFAHAFDCTQRVADMAFAVGGEEVV